MTRIIDEDPKNFLVEESSKVQELEDSYLESCRHNNTTPEDMKYFRLYVWNLFVIFAEGLENRGDFE